MCCERNLWLYAVTKEILSDCSISILKNGPKPCALAKMKYFTSELCVFSGFHLCISLVVNEIFVPEKCSERVYNPQNPLIDT